MPEIRPGDDLAQLIVTALSRGGRRLRDGDIVAVAQKVVSKAEGRLVVLASVVPGTRALAMAAESGKDPRVLEIVLGETADVIRWERGVLISRTRHGFICANAGVDQSNTGAAGTLVLLPVDPDASAARLRTAFQAMASVDVATVITDTFGRPWREGHANIAVGVAGLPPLERFAGQTDADGYELRLTEIAVADEIAAASELVMGKLDRRPAAVIRGLRWSSSAETAQAYIRPPERDFFH